MYFSRYVSVFLNNHFAYIVYIKIINIRMAK